MEAESQNTKSSSEAITKDFDLIEQGQNLNDWFVFRDQRHFGPLTTQQVSRFLLKKQISTVHHIWRPGFENWKQIKNVENFRSCGFENIDFISDNEFSEKAQLGDIDRLKKDEINLTSDPLPKNTNIKNLTSLDLSYYLKKSFEGKNKWISSSALVLVGLMLVSFAVWMGTRDTAFIRNLPQDLQAKLSGISQSPESLNNIKFGLFEGVKSQPDPVLVGATNLPVGSHLRIEVKGQANTLLNSYRFSQSFEMPVENKIFQTPQIRGATGQFVPAGFYDVSVTCLDCKETNEQIFNRTFAFGIQDHSTYKDQLQTFHSEVRSNARLELNELGDVQAAMNEQYDQSLKTFVKPNLDQSTWNEFSANWLQTQNKMIDLFSQVDKAEFREDVFYLGLYKSYRFLAQRIFELHATQNKAIMNKEGDKSIFTKNISELSQEISLNLTYLKSQLDLMNLNFSQSKGFPSKKGLKLDELQGID